MMDTPEYASDMRKAARKAGFTEEAAGEYVEKMIADRHPPADGDEATMREVAERCINGTQPWHTCGLFGCRTVLALLDALAAAQAERDDNNRKYAETIGAYDRVYQEAKCDLAAAQAERDELWGKVGRMEAVGELVGRQLQRVITDRDAARLQCERLRDVLERYQWDVVDGTAEMECCECDGNPDRGHEPGCLIGNALSPSPAPEPTRGTL
jgi:hypothetical protein